METNHKPATALPWRKENTNSGYFLAGATPGYFVEVRPTQDAKQVKQDAAYIVTACNAYPELIAKLKRCQAALRANGAPNCEAMKESTALLAKLGEAT